MQRGLCEAGVGSICGPHLAVVYGEEVARQASRTVAPSWSADAQAGLEAFLDDNPCAEYGHVALHSLQEGDMSDDLSGQ